MGTVAVRRWTRQQYEKMVEEGSLYARAGLREFWVVNLLDRRLEVHRDPIRQADAHSGWGYRTVEHYAGGDSLFPLAAPQSRVAVADLLP